MYSDGSEKKFPNLRWFLVLRRNDLLRLLRVDDGSFCTVSPRPQTSPLPRLYRENGQQPLPSGVDGGLCTHAPLKVSLCERRIFHSTRSPPKHAQRVCYALTSSISPCLAPGVRGGGSRWGAADVGEAGRRAEGHVRSRRGEPTCMHPCAPCDKYVVSTKRRAQPRKVVQFRALCVRRTRNRCESNDGSFCNSLGSLFLYVSS